MPDLTCYLKNPKLWKELDATILAKRLKWLESNRHLLETEKTPVEKAFKATYLKLDVDPKDLHIVEKTDKKIVYRSFNSCPALDACVSLGLDTRKVCKGIYENCTAEFIRAVHPNVKFSRNYNKIRPYADYCEETLEEV